MSADGSPEDATSQAGPAAVVEQLYAYVAYHLGSGLDAFPVGGAPSTQPSSTTSPPEMQDRREPAGQARQDMPPGRPLPKEGARNPQTAPVQAAPPEPPEPFWDDEPPARPAVIAAATPDTAGAGTLAALRAVIGDCQRCKLCSAGRTQIVFGVGNPNAELMFVGEGPGADEDRKGEPFVGKAGVLLTDIITKGMKIRREDVYIANVVKCRPPENRDPEPDEIVACRPFLQRQIQLVRPKVLVALGRFAAQTMLGVTTPISRLRGQWHDYDGIKLMPTLHPAYLLRNPADKRLVWEDIQLVMRELGLAKPA